MLEKKERRCVGFKFERNLSEKIVSANIFGNVVAYIKVYG